MAATSWNGLQPRLAPEYGEIPEIMDFPETAAQTFKAGTPVMLTTTAGTVAICEDSTAGFLGIAMEDASGTTAANLAVQVCRGDTPIIARVTANGTDALPTTLTKGVAYGWYADADSVFYVDSAETSTVAVVYEDPVYDVNGDSTYWGKFKLVKRNPGNLDEVAAIIA